MNKYNYPNYTVYNYLGNPLRIARLKKTTVVPLIDLAPVLGIKRQNLENIINDLADLLEVYLHRILLPLTYYDTHVCKTVTRFDEINCLEIDSIVKILGTIFLSKPADSEARRQIINFERWAFFELKDLIIADFHSSELDAVSDLDDIVNVPSRQLRNQGVKYVCLKYQICPHTAIRLIASRRAELGLDPKGWLTKSFMDFELYDIPVAELLAVIILRNKKREQLGNKNLRNNQLFMERFQEQMIGKGFSLKDVADKLNLQVDLLYKYESGLIFPCNETLIKLCKLFEVSPEYLIGLDTDHTLI